jgi:nucleoporin NUP1
MLFNTVNGGREDEERMSVDGERGRDVSVLVSPIVTWRPLMEKQDWFMRDRWREPGSPASLAASRRLGSTTPSSALPPIRKGQLVWNGEKGFVRESELKSGKADIKLHDKGFLTIAAEQPKPVHQNDAERILFALESMRKTPLTEARSSTSFTSGSSLPAELIGSSSRQFRKSINVPLATAQAGESAKQRRDKERLGDDYNVMISPYGRRKQVDRKAVEARKEAKARAATNEMDVGELTNSFALLAEADCFKTTVLHPVVLPLQLMRRVITAPQHPVYRDDPVP